MHLYSMALSGEIPSNIEPAYVETTYRFLSDAPLQTEGPDYGKNRFLHAFDYLNRNVSMGVATTAIIAAVALTLHASEPKPLGNPHIYQELNAHMRPLAPQEEFVSAVRIAASGKDFAESTQVFEGKLVNIRLTPGTVDNY